MDELIYENTARGDNLNAIMNDAYELIKQRLYAINGVEAVSCDMEVSMFNARGAESSLTISFAKEEKPPNWPCNLKP